MFKRSSYQLTVFLFSFIFFFTCLTVAGGSGFYYSPQENNPKLDALQKSLDNAKKLYSEAQKNGNRKEEAEALFSMGVCWQNFLDYDQASDCLIQSQKIFEELGDSKKIARNLVQLGDLYRAIGEYDSSIKFSQKSLSIFEAESDQAGIAKSCEKLAATYYQSTPTHPERIDSVFYFIARTLSISRAMRNDSLTSSAMNILGAAYLTNNKYDSAIVHLKNALAFAESKNFLNDAALIKCNLSFAYYNKKEYSTAIEYALQTYTYAEKENVLPYVDMSSLSLYMSYKLAGDFQNAFKFSEIYNNNRWKIYDEKRIHRIKALEIKYESEKNELELANEKKMAFLWIIVFSLIILAGIAVLSFYIYRHKIVKKKNIELEAKNALILEQNAKLVELNATKDKFFSIIGHDLKNPYQSLIGFSNILIQDYKELTEDEIKEFVGYIYEASEMGNRLLQNLLDWSRSETGRLKYEPEQFPLYEIINEAVNLAGNTTMQKDINIELSIPEDQIVFCDRNMVYTVLRNLVSNAIKFSYRGGKINIYSVSKNSHVEIAVADNGVGMNDALIEDLFKLDKRITTDGTEHEKGTGLGLFLCKEFIEKNHGTISVNSEAGKGSTFILTLPVSNNV